MDPTEPLPILRFAGRLHPLVVHFPIALLLVAALLQLPRGKRPPSDTVRVLTNLGALSAVVAAGAGWLYAEGDPLGSSVADQLFWHRWTGVAAAVLAVVTAWLGRRAARSEEPSGAFLCASLLTAGLVGGGAHLGGELVYGEGFLFEVFEEREPRERAAEPAPVAPEPAEPEPGKEVPTDGSEEAVPGRDADAGEPVATASEGDVTADPSLDPVTSDPVTSGSVTSDPGALSTFQRDVLPIFEARCFECHGATGRAKAGLRLHEEEQLFEGDPVLWVVTPGDPEGSFLYELITLPEDDVDVMPPSDGKLTPEEIATIRRWIEELPPRD